MKSLLRSRRRAGRLVAALLVLSLLLPAGVSALTNAQNDHPDLRAGTVERPANGSTVVAIQGFHYKDQGAEKKPARLVSAGPNGTTEWVHSGVEDGVAWFYDVDPLPDGNLLVVSTKPGHTLVYEYDPEADAAVWTETLDTDDTHDVDLLPDGDLVVADMRNWNNETKRSEDRLFVYNRSRDEITWEWSFADHYPANTDNGIRTKTRDWTHVNDVDVVDEDTLLVSPRNFDQVVFLNRTSGEIEDRLGEDDAHRILNEQHNPDYLESENGTPTVLVADSENDRVVEYEKRGDDWVRTWQVGGHGQLNWPRDADRLPNGNTLVTDSLNHRVVEVTPEGKIVWEYYATWGPYDAERLSADGSSGSSSGPTITDVNASGSYNLTGSAGLRPGTGQSETFAVQMSSTFAGTVLEGPMTEFATRWSHVAPWVRPTWMSGWDLFFTGVALFVVVGWVLVELVYYRRELVAGVRRAAGRGR